MEINPRHPLIIEMNKRVKDKKEVPEEVKDMAMVLLDTALLNSGFHMEDSGDFSQRMYRVMKSAFGLESLDLVDHVEVPDEPETADDEGEEDEEELFDDDDDDDDDEDEAKDEAKAADADKPKAADAQEDKKDDSAKDEL